MDRKVDAVCAVVDCDTNLEGIVGLFLDGYAGPEFLDNAKRMLDLVTVTNSSCPIWFWGVWRQHHPGLE